MPSKLSIHTGFASPQAMEFVRRGRPPLVKLVDNFGAEGQIKATSPGTVVIGRRYFPQQANMGEGNPRFRAREIFEAQRETYLAHPYIDYWEGWNEPTASTPQDMAWYAELEIERMELLAGIGRRACLANFSAGCPAVELWPYFYPALRAAMLPEHRAILGLHEYNAPWIDSFFGKNQINPASDEGDTGWTIGRYRKVYRNHLLPAGLGIPLAITEAGIDGLVMAGPRAVYRFDDAPRGGGWRGFGQWWKEHGGLDNPAQEYLRQLAWYDARLCADPYVIGATIFQIGQIGDGWASFDIDGEMIDLLTRYAERESLRPGAPVLTPPVQPSPPPSSPEPLATAPTPAPAPPASPPPTVRGRPRIQYERTYVLLPPNASAELMRAAMAYFSPDRFTFGFSADDAGIGDLDSRRVIAIDPETWSGDLQAFFDEHYPGTQFTTLGSAAIYARTKVFGRE